jgi:surface antigen
LITFRKDGFRQQDVPVRRQYQTEVSLLKAINSGVNDAKFFKDAAWGVNSAVKSIEWQRASGEAYALVPSTVSLRLVPESGFAQKTTDEQASKSLEDKASSVELMDSEDEHMLETALENSPTNHQMAWTNNRSGYSFAVAAEDAQMENGSVVRRFTLAARKDGRIITDRYAAYRTGRGEWAVGGLPKAGQQTAQPPAQPASGATSDVLGAARALAESTTPSVGKDWKVKESSHSTTTRQPDGSVVTKSKSTSTKMGVHVNPAAAAIGLIDALQGMGNQGN